MIIPTSRGFASGRRRRVHDERRGEGGDCGPCAPSTAPRAPRDGGHASNGGPPRPTPGPSSPAPPSASSSASRCSGPSTPTRSAPTSSHRRPSSPSPHSLRRRPRLLRRRSRCHRQRLPMQRWRAQPWCHPPHRDRNWWNRSRCGPSPTWTRHLPSRPPPRRPLVPTQRPGPRAIARARKMILRGSTKLRRRNNHRPEFHHLPWGRPLPPPRIDPPPTQGPPRAERRARGNRTPVIPPIRPPRPSRIHPTRHPVFPTMETRGPTDLEARERRRAARESRRATDPRPTRRAALADIREEFADLLPGERVTRSSPYVAQQYHETLRAWRRRQRFDPATTRVGA